MYRLPSENDFGPIRCLPGHMLCNIPSKSPHFKNHLETSVMFDLTQPALVSDDTTSEEDRDAALEGRVI